jgi:hypothetical protein
MNDEYAPGAWEPVDNMRVLITQIGFVRTDVIAPTELHRSVEKERIDAQMVVISAYLHSQMREDNRTM